MADKKSNIKLDECEVDAHLDKFQNRYEKAITYGKRIGKNTAKKFTAVPRKNKEKAYRKDGLDIDAASEALSEMLLQCYTKEQRDNCGDLLIQWTIEKFWGKVVETYIPKLEKIWKYLHDNKRNKNNPITYGDIDGDVWVEYIRQEKEWEDKRKIIIHKSHCSCANDRTHIFILDTSKHCFGDKLRVRTVWDKQNSKGGYSVEKSKKYPNGWFSWGDDRDIKIPSLRTYRDRNFEFSYGDGRDKGYVLSLKTFGGQKIEWAHINQWKVTHSLKLIDLIKNITEDIKEYEC